MKITGKLSLVATPIGNLEDITLRALKTLKDADRILAEDTRVTKRLLLRHAIDTVCMPFHHHTKASVYGKIFTFLKEGKHLAFVCDAGTPGISDPGNMLVCEVFKEFGDTVTIEPIPGASALTTALSVAGVPTDRFTFYGFIPHKKGKMKILQEIEKDTKTAVFFESPHRISKTLDALSFILDESRDVVVLRELTKKFETIYRGAIEDVKEKVIGNQRGEFVIIIGPK